MEQIILAITSLLVSLLAFYSGFGLGTILMPVMAIFFPLPVAIALTAVVHLLHNCLKTALLYKSIDWSVVLKFGSIAILAAIPGSFLLKWLADLEPIYKFSIFSIPAKFSILHIIVGSLLILFATGKIKFYEEKNLFIGGVLSGFFGGLSGNQGAFRNAFLINMNINKESYIATTAMISVAIDLIRLVIYTFTLGYFFENVPVISMGITIGSALGGVILGRLLLPQFSFEWIKKIVVVLLYLFGVLLILGIV